LFVPPKLLVNIKMISTFTLPWLEVGRSFTVTGPITIESNAARLQAKQRRLSTLPAPVTVHEAPFWQLTMSSGIHLA
jgi:hypothetical protein